MVFCPSYPVTSPAISHSCCVSDAHLRDFPPIFEKFSLFEDWLTFLPRRFYWIVVIFIPTPGSWFWIIPYAPLVLGELFSRSLINYATRRKKYPLSLIFESLAIWTFGGIWYYIQYLVSLIPYSRVWISDKGYFFTPGSVFHLFYLLFFRQCLPSLQIHIPFTIFAFSTLHWSAFLHEPE